MKNGFATQIETVQGNYGYNLAFTCTDSAGVAVDLSNATLLFKAQIDSDRPVQFSGAMNIVNGPAGTCYYTVASTDFSVPGTWNAQIIATYAGEILTFTGITIQVDPALPIT